MSKLAEKLNQKGIKKVSYTFHSDPGHSWLEVPYQDVIDTGIKFSTFSYFSHAKNCAYLEEDSDVSKFIQYLKDNNIEFEIKEEFIDYESPIRNLQILRLQM